jgi:hypothetical protein
MFTETPKVIQKQTWDLGPLGQCSDRKLQKGNEGIRTWNLWVSVLIESYRRAMVGGTPDQTLLKVTEIRTDGLAV